MTMPLPDYVPSPVREIILNKYGAGGMKSFAADLGVPYTTVVNNFRSNAHRSLSAFLEAADRLGLSGEELAPILQVAPGARKKWLDAKLGHPSESIKDMSPDGSADVYLYSLLSGRVGNPINRFYSPLSKKLKMSLRELEEALCVE